MPGIPILERMQIVTLSVAGLPQQEIADMTGRSRSSVNRIVKAFSTEARLTNLPRGHRPKVTTDSDDDRIVEAARRNPKMTAKEIRKDLGLAASTQIVRERLHVGGLRSRVAAMKPFVSSRNRVKRLLFAQEHRSWTVEEWRNVIFTDESTFTSKWDQQQRTWRTQGTRFDAPNLHRVASSGRCSVNVWGSISKDGLGPLVRLDGRFTAAAYTDLLDSVVIPYALNGPFEDGLFSFQHDRSPIHTASSVNRLLEESLSYGSLHWVAMDLSKLRKPDLVMLCEEMGIEVAALRRKPLLIQALEDSGADEEELSECWELIQERMKRANEDKERETVRRKEEAEIQIREIERLRLQLQIVEAKCASSVREENAEIQADARMNMRDLLQPYKMSEDIALFLVNFERTCARVGFDRATWPQKLLTVLPCEAADTLARLPETDADDYNKIKAALLKKFRLSVEAFRRRFWDAQKTTSETFQEFAFNMKADLVEWLKGEGVYEDRDKVAITRYKARELAAERAGEGEQPRAVDPCEQASTSAGEDGINAPGESRESWVFSVWVSGMRAHFPAKVRQERSTARPTRSTLWQEELHELDTAVCAALRATFNQGTDG
ncbi:hypothetical protein HPB50_011940 [Hyalomma asiaticum]|uniref:Uncharacterized protein n=1 Tax=Hyalomma asiaticum TaxID=266040 RepID=A0ACB7RLQ1_HYAAI|nr:hypothetical protein HPB50_011940 [Hyalomma asiaticum]